MNNSFSIFLNIVLGILFIGSLIFSSFFGNFGGISLKELNENYILKDEVSFSNLPINEQKKYTDKDKLKKIEVESATIFDNDGNPVLEDSSDLKQLVVSLQNKISFLEKENLLLTTDKDELLKIVKYEKSKNNLEQQTLLSSNLEKINEAEKQHFQNISELTRKINDLQRENIKLSQQINKKEVKYKDLEASLKKQIEDQKRLLLEKENNLENIFNKKIITLKNRNKSQQNLIEELKNRLISKDSLGVIELGKRDQKISFLENKINKMMIEKNIFLTQKSKDILDMEKENSLKLQELHNIVKNSNLEKEAIKEEYKKILEKVKKRHKELDEKLQKEIDRLNRELSDEKQNSMEKLANSKKIIIENNKKFKKEIDNLKAQVDILKISNDKILVKLNSKKLELSNSKDKILQLEDKIKVIDQRARDIDKEVEREVFKNEKKHNENYKILNQKLAELETDIKSKQKRNNKLLLDFSSEKDELSKKLNDMVNKNIQKDSEIQNLKNLLKKVEKKNKNLELDDKDKLAAIKKSFDDLKDTVKIKEKEYKLKIKELESDIFLKNSELSLRQKDKEKLGKYIRDITALKKTIKEIESKKRVFKSSNNFEFLGKVECNDMVSGNFKISDACKTKVNKFLSKYKKTDFFEVIPIVGSGGFAALNKVKRDAKLGIPDSEITRLTRLANIGLGRDRAKEGGWLIRNKFGDDTKISYTVYSIESKNKRGFVIRAYR